MIRVSMGVSAHITDNTPADTDDVEILLTPHGDRPYVQVQYIPIGDDDESNDESYHKVVVRGSKLDDAPYEHRRTDCLSERNEATKYAVSLAEKFDIPLVDRIHRYECIDDKK